MGYELEIVHPRRTGLSQPGVLAGAYRWPYQLIAHCRRLKRYVIIPVEVQIWYREAEGSRRDLLYRFRLLPPAPGAPGVGMERQRVTSRRDVALTHPLARGERSRFDAFP
ncbi:hypothetical protein [Thermogemmatispora sp.]|uniref:hypothetical protein n=1 Tax=Thermogemmatispora sp. TaxID=1968838 RepID=UPI001DE6E9FC|nr:hypothetical protein [Thermogemmatispora sp.]MBX5450891.1 hypothetical protein [Thermogemmatispora sp.]